MLWEYNLKMILNSASLKMGEEEMYLITLDDFISKKRTESYINKYQKQNLINRGKLYLTEEINNRICHCFTFVTMFTNNIYNIPFI